MFGTKFYRLVGPMALLVTLAVCEPGERDSMLPSGAREANPERSPTGRARPPGDVPIGQHVVSLARDLARAPYRAPSASSSSALQSLDYDAYRAILFRREAALWADDGPFRVHLAHPGFIFHVPVRIHTVERGEVASVPFDTGLFEYGESARHVAAAVGADAGYSGFRVLHPLNATGVFDEVVVFQGASYFRLLGAGHTFGLSARGLAVDLGGPSEEEFPDFTDFWLVRPERGDSSLVFHALLDAPSVSGAYRFELDPGPPTVLEVDARLFARRDVTKLGVAPLSSMFLYGPIRSGDFDDFRPEVHDSDGLMMQTRAGEWLWRPLSNRTGIRGSALRDADPRGFGLAQRARGFERYLDAEALYHRRPSLWTEVVDGDWGVGGVELLEIPTGSEFEDNIAVAWVPDGPVLAGEERSFRYRLVPFDDRWPGQTLAQVERTGVGRDALPGTPPTGPPGRRRFIVDFRSVAVGGEDAGSALRPVLETSAGRISDVRLIPLPPDGAWRVSFRLDPDGGSPADMRLFLTSGDERVSETWTYVWYPDEQR